MRKGYKKIEVYFPDAEYEVFLKKVKRTNLSISEFVRRMAADQVIREAPHADVPLLIREVKRVGNNINQLLFLANSKGFFDMKSEDCTPSLSQALKMREFSKAGKLSMDVIFSIMTQPKANQKEKISFHVNDLRDYFPQGYTAAQMSQEIFRLLEDHRARTIRRRDRDER